MTIPIEKLHQHLIYIRRAEELIASLYPDGEMKTPMHSSLGQEAISVGVCAALNLPHDVIFASHRSHASYLASGASFEALCAELYGKASGCSGGRGGSVHLTSREHGYIASSAILAQSIPVATGAALAFKLRQEPHVAVAFFGDAAMEEGTIYESFNYASLMRLPIVYVCENNSMSTEASFDSRFPEGTELCDRAVMFRVGGMKVDGNDVQEVYRTATTAINHARQGQPIFLECTTFRWLEHVGPNYDHDMPNRPDFRSAEAIEFGKASDPLLISQETMGSDYDETYWNTVDSEIQGLLEEAVERARKAPEPDKSTLFDNVY